MLKQVTLILLWFFLTEVALAGQLSVMYCVSDDHSEYFFTSKENIEFLKNQPAGSFADAMETREAASHLPPAEVDVHQGVAPAFEQFELALPSECRQMDFSTVGYGGIHFIFSKYTLEGLQESVNPVVIARLPAAAKNDAPMRRIARIIVTYILISALVKTLVSLTVNYEQTPQIMAVLGGLWCLANPNKCANAYNYFTEY